jgi:hypothetical protein
MDQFELMYPDIAQFWQKPTSLDTLTLPKMIENAPIYDSWDKAAKRLINSLWKYGQSYIFHNPVDPEKMGLPDYNEIVKTPMDFSTIKERLNANYYHRM